MVLIDDAPDLRELLREALSAHGFDVVGEAGDGLAGIEAAGRTQPDVIMLDLSMPVLDGLEALPFLRRLCPMARIIVYSTFSAPDVADRVRAAGAAGFIRKGVSVETLVRNVEEIASGAAAAEGRFPLVTDPATDPATGPVTDTA